jgi:probable HAF family extracellular repeat protein
VGFSTPAFVWPSAINNRGTIVGMFRNSGIPDTAAFVVADGEWTVILPDDASWTNAVDVNASGRVLGLEYSFQEGLRVFVWEKGVTTYLDLDLPHSSPYPPNVFPVDLTDSGAVVGYYYDYGPIPGEPPLMKSFIWDKGKMELVQAPGSDKVQVFEMNARGPVVGQYYTGPGYGDTRAFVWEDGVMTDLPDLGGGPSGAVGIDSRGQIAGVAMTPNGDMHAVLWEDGDILDGGTLGGAESYAYGINERGQVIGWSRTVSGAIHGFIWERERLDEAVGDGGGAAYVTARVGAFPAPGRPPGLRCCAVAVAPVRRQEDSRWRLPRWSMARTWCAEGEPSQGCRQPHPVVSCQQRTPVLLARSARHARRR